MLVKLPVVTSPEPPPPENDILGRTLYPAPAVPMVKVLDIDSGFNEFVFAFSFVVVISDSLLFKFVIFHRKVVGTDDSIVVRADHHGFGCVWQWDV